MIKNEIQKFKQFKITLELDRICDPYIKISSKPTNPSYWVYKKDILTISIYYHYQYTLSAYKFFQNAAFLGRDFLSIISLIIIAQGF